MTPKTKRLALCVLCGALVQALTVGVTWITSPTAGRVLLWNLWLVNEISPLGLAGAETAHIVTFAAAALVLGVGVYSIASYFALPAFDARWVRRGD
jgi:hypothetical protein